MSESTDTDTSMIQIDKMSVDQFAGAVVLILGAVGSLLLVIWQSKCACRCRIGLSEKCYIFDCERRPPSEEELKTLADEAKALKNKTDKMDKKEDKIIKKEDEILDEVESQKSLSRSNSQIELETINLDSPKP